MPTFCLVCVSLRIKLSTHRVIQQRPVQWHRLEALLLLLLLLLLLVPPLQAVVRDEIEGLCLGGCVPGRARGC